MNQKYNSVMKSLCAAGLVLSATSAFAATAVPDWTGTIGLSVMITNTIKLVNTNHSGFTGSAWLLSYDNGANTVKGDHDVEIYTTDISKGVTVVAQGDATDGSVQIANGPNVIPMTVTLGGQALSTTGTDMTPKALGFTGTGGAGYSQSLTLEVKNTDPITPTGGSYLGNLTLQLTGDL